MITGQLKMASSTMSRVFGASKVAQLMAATGFGHISPPAGTACRFLYTKEALGLNGYENARERTASQLGAMKDRFKTRMEQYLAADSKSLIFTEDLKNMLYLADTDADLDMVEKMMKKFVKQNEQFRFGSFVFGPVVMRMYYHLDKPDAALAAIQNPDLQTFFDQLTSYQALLDLLYSKKRYSDVLKVYDLLSAREFFAGRFPKECLVLALAAMHKIGTPAAYEKCKTLLKAARDGNAPVMRKGVSYAADLALKNKDYAGALEILTLAQNQQYVSVRNLKALALVALDRVEDVFPILRSVLEHDAAFVKQRTSPSFFGDVMNQVKAAVEKKNDKELTQEFDKILKQMTESGHLDETSTLDDFLEREIEDSKPRANADGSVFGSSRFGDQQTGGFGAGMRQPRYPDSGRQPRYPDDNRQENRYGSGFRQNRSSFGQDSSSQLGRLNQSSGTEGYQRGFQRRDNFTYQARGAGLQDDESGQQQQSGGYRQQRPQQYQRRDDDPNAQAGYRPTTGFQRNRGSGGGGFGEDSPSERSERYSSNADAGYRPRTGYQRNAGGGGAARQGLQDLDD